VAKGLSSEKIAFCKAILSGSTKLPDNGKLNDVCKRACQFALDSDTKGQWLEAVDFYNTAKTLYKRATKVSDKIRVTKTEREEVQAKNAYKLFGESVVAQANKRAETANIRKALYNRLANE
jgi:hypothetical protein